MMAGVFPASVDRAAGGAAGGVAPRPDGPGIGFTAADGRAGCTELRTSVSAFSFFEAMPTVIVRALTRIRPSFTDGGGPGSPGDSVISNVSWAARCTAR